jgi:hypothetical protein
MISCLSLYNYIGRLEIYFKNKIILTTYNTIDNGVTMDFTYLHHLRLRSMISSNPHLGDSISDSYINIHAKGFDFC